MSQYRVKNDREMADRKDRNLVNWNTMNNQAFIKALMSADTPDLMRLFLDDLLTKTEIETFVRKFQAAYLIALGTPYTYIIRETGMSSKGIARISRSMTNKRNGFHVIIKKMHPNGMHYSD